MTQLMDKLKRFKYTPFPDKEIENVVKENTSSNPLIGLKYESAPSHTIKKEIHKCTRVVYSSSFEDTPVDYYYDYCKECGVVRKVGILLEDSTNTAYEVTFYKKDISLNA